MGFSETAQQSKKISAGISAAMKASFFGQFSAEIGTSLTTGYDWTQTSSIAQTETHQFHVETVVPAHTLLIIEGAEGDCADNNVKTEMFRIKTVDPEGNVISQKLEDIH